ncbi:uncharacterized protein LOC125140130, partial [Tachysurus ichikawai]
MLPGFERHDDKCCTVAARHTAEGDMFKKPRNMRRHEMRSPSPTAGGSARFPVSGSPHGTGDDVITTVSRGYRLQFAMKPPRFNGLIMSVIGSCVDRRNRNPPAQAGNQSGTRGGKPSGLLLPLFHSSEEGRRGPPSHFGSACVKRAPQKVFIQNADTQGAVPIDSPKRLVCDDRSGGRILPHRYLSLSQEIPQVCIPGHSIRISNYTVRAVVSSEGFYQMCGGSPVPVEGQGHKDIVLHRRLSDILGVIHHTRRRDCPESPQGPGFQDKHDKEPAGALSTDRVFRAQLGLPFVSSHIDGRENSVFHTMSRSFSERTSGPVQAVLTDAGAYGFCDRGSAFGATQNEGFSALDRTFASVLSPASQLRSDTGKAL